MIRHPTELRRTDWPLRQKPQVVLVELGANDDLRGIDVCPLITQNHPFAQLHEAIANATGDDGIKVQTENAP